MNLDTEEKPCTPPTSPHQQHRLHFRQRGFYAQNEQNYV